MRSPTSASAPAIRAISIIRSRPRPGASRRCSSAGIVEPGRSGRRVRMGACDGDQDDQDGKGLEHHPERVETGSGRVLAGALDPVEEEEDGDGYSGVNGRANELVDPEELKVGVAYEAAVDEEEEDAGGG